MVFCEEKKLLVESVIESARDGTDAHGLYYQNDIEVIHAVQKCIQNSKKLDVLGVVQNLQRLEQRQDAEEVQALCGAGKYVLAKPYQRFKVPSIE